MIDIANYKLHLLFSGPAEFLLLIIVMVLINLADA